MREHSVESDFGKYEVREWVSYRDTFVNALMNEDTKECCKQPPSPLPRLNLKATKFWHIFCVDMMSIFERIRQGPLKDTSVA